MSAKHHRDWAKASKSLRETFPSRLKPTKPNNQQFATRVILFASRLHKMHFCTDKSKRKTFMHDETSSGNALEKVNWSENKASKVPKSVKYQSFLGRHAASICTTPSSRVSFCHLEVPIKDASCHPSIKNDATPPQVVETIANMLENFVKAVYK